MDSLDTPGQDICPGAQGTSDSLGACDEKQHLVSNAPETLTAILRAFAEDGQDIATLCRALQGFAYQLPPGDPFREDVVAVLFAAIEPMQNALTPAAWAGLLQPLIVQSPTFQACQAQVSRIYLRLELAGMLGEARQEVSDQGLQTVLQDMVGHLIGAQEQEDAQLMSSALAVATPAQLPSVVVLWGLQSLLDKGVAPHSLQAFAQQCLKLPLLSANPGQLPIWVKACLHRLASGATVACPLPAQDITLEALDEPIQRLTSRVQQGLASRSCEHTPTSGHGGIQPQAGPHPVASTTYVASPTGDGGDGTEDGHSGRSDQEAVKDTPIPAADIPAVRPRATLLWYGLSAAVTAALGLWYSSGALAEESADKFPAPPGNNAGSLSPDPTLVSANNGNHASFSWLPTLLGVVATGAMGYLGERTYQQWQAHRHRPIPQPPQPAAASPASSEAASGEQPTTVAAYRPLPAQKPVAALDNQQPPQAASTTEPAGRTRSVVGLLLAAALASALANPWLQKAAQSRQRRVPQAAPTA